MASTNAKTQPAAHTRLRQSGDSPEPFLLQEERRKERTRIARELHDTFLQGLLSASMQLSLADDWVPAESPAKPVLRRVLEIMRKGIDEGRAALEGLRSPQLHERSLEKALSDFLSEIALSEQERVRVVVVGEIKPLESPVEEQIFLIAREALLNALRHSEASKVEAEIEYLPHRLRVVVRDAGRGIDPRVLRLGKKEHWGLRGMLERAGSIGAKIRIWSKPGHGTEVEISLPVRERKRSVSLA